MQVNLSEGFPGRGRRQGARAEDRGQPGRRQGQGQPGRRQKAPGRRQKAEGITTETTEPRMAGVQGSTEPRMAGVYEKTGRGKQRMSPGWPGWVFDPTHIYDYTGKSFDSHCYLEEDEWKKAGGSGQPGRKQGDKEDKEDKEDKGQQPPFTLME